MDGILGIFQSIINSEHLDIYLTALDEHQSLRGKSDVVVQTISSLMTKSNRHLGLQLLNKFLDQFTLEVLEQKATIWITSALKALNPSELQEYGPLLFDTLTKLVSKLNQSTELTKSFTSNHLNKIYEALVLVPNTCCLEALICTETCLRLFPGAIGVSRGHVERYLVRFVDAGDNELFENVGKCYHLLQQLRGGGPQGLSHKTQWQNYQVKLLGSLHLLLNQAFSKCNELYDESTETTEKLPIPELQLENEPIQRMAQIYIRFRNLLGYLNIALRSPFPVEKPVMPKKILYLIRRGLGVTCQMLQENAISDNLALGALLPKMHYHLLELLSTLMQLLRGHLILHQQLIVSLLADMLKCTKAFSTGLKKPLSNLRIKTYELISQWCFIMRSGSRCDTIADFLTTEILNDVLPFQTEFTLKVQSGARKHLSKKARRQLHKIQNEKSNLSQTHSTNNALRKENLTDDGNAELCIAALRCLHQLLQSSSNFLKPSTLNIIQTKIIQISGLLYEFPLKRQQLYYNWTCRLEIYNILCTLVMTPHHMCPPPTQLILHVLQTAQTRDSVAEVRHCCGKMLLHLEKLVHPQKESLLFPADLRVISNNLKKCNQEYSLNNIFSNHNHNQNYAAEMENNEHQNGDDSLNHQDSSDENTEVAVEESININDDSDECSKNSTKNEEKLDSPSGIAANDISDSRHDESEASSASTNNNIITLTSDEEGATAVEQVIDVTRISDDSVEGSEDEMLEAPVTKKQKLQNDNEDNTSVIATPNESVTILKTPLEESDEDMLLADIEATFVDELN